jgi:hypothetical protein
MKYIMLAGYSEQPHKVELVELSLDFPNDIAAIIEAPMFGARYDYWLLTDTQNNTLAHYMPQWGDTAVVNIL